MIVSVLLPYFVAHVARKEHEVSDQIPIMITRAKKVVAACKLAAAAGVQPGMTQRQAEWLCGNVQHFPVPTQHIHHATEEILTILCQFTHLVEIEALTGYSKDARLSLIAYVDMERLNEVDSLRLVKSMGAALREAGYEAAIGLAATKFTAYATAARVACGQIRYTRPGQEALTLADLPVSLLPLDAETERRLMLLGLNTLGACAALPMSTLQAQFGKTGFMIHQLVRGADPRPISPTRPQIVARAVRQSDVPLTDQAVLEAALYSIASELAARLKLNGSMGRTLLLRCVFDDKRYAERKSTLRQPVADGLYIGDALKRLFGRIKVVAPITEITATLTDLVPFAGRQLDLFTDQPKARERLRSRLPIILVNPDAPDLYWVICLDPDARRIELRYAWERIVG